jgi:prepilin-type N-terminal cleavage/methylation domain-containing protein
MTSAGTDSGPAGFTLIEMLLVVAVIGVMTSLIIAAVTNSASDARLVVARQQQAVVQEALNAWISSQAMGMSGISTAKSNYTAASTAVAKLALLEDYLDPSTYEHLVDFSTNSAAVQSDAMTKVGVGLVFSTWDASNSYPRVNMQ